MLEFWLDPESVYFKDEKLDMNKEMIVFNISMIPGKMNTKSYKHNKF